MKCRYEEESNIFAQPATCTLTGGVCGICNNGDYTFCAKYKNSKMVITVYWNC